MRDRMAAALVLAATALVAPAAATAGAAPAPGELWSKFPLDPPAATTPAPAPAKVVEQRAPPQGADSGGDRRTTWVLAVLGAVAAACAGSVAVLRGATNRRQAGGGDEHTREPAENRTLERPVWGGATGGVGSVAVLTRTDALARTRTAPTLIETLSPQARQADQLDGRENEAGLATHQVCEIACWRGYVRWQFYVESESLLEASFVSPYFRARGSAAPEQTDAALQAHAVLVKQLTTAGWEPEGYGEDWFSERFQRTRR